MENRFANSAAKLVVQMGQVIPGVIHLGTELGLAPNLAGMLTAEKEGLELTQRRFLDARLNLKEKRKELEAALKVGRNFATILRTLRKEELGPKNSREWEALGFRGSKQVPLTKDKLFVMLGAMAGYLGNRPDLNYSGINITAAEAEVLQATLTHRAVAVNAAKAEVQFAVQTRAVLLAKARRLMRKVFNDLAYVLDPLDGRWTQFGFNQPGLKKTPAAPEDLKVTVFESGIVAVECPPVPLAERYRVWVRVVGVDAELKPARLSPDPTFVLEDVARGAEVEFGMTALNQRGEGRMSERRKLTIAADVGKLVG